MKMLTLDFGGSSLKYGVMDDQGNLSLPGSAPAPLSTVAEFQDLVKKVYDSLPCAVEGIAISLPGFINCDDCVLLGSGAYTNLHGKNIRSIIREKLPGVKVSVQNDGKCAALAEAWIGELAGVADGVVVILGTGIAGGVLKDGKIHAGKAFTAGEFSYYACGPMTCGLTGTLTCCAGAAGITAKMCIRKNYSADVQDAPEMVQMLMDQLRAADHLAVPEEPPKPVKIDGKAFFALLTEKGPDAEAVYDELISGLSHFLFNVQILYSPEKIALGGGLCRDPRIIADVKCALQKIYGVVGPMNPVESEIVPCRMSSDTNLYGAAYQFLLTYGGGK